MDEQTLDVLVNYTASALKLCSTWTHSDVLLALSTIVYGNGSQCHQVSYMLRRFESVVDEFNGFIVVAVYNQMKCPSGTKVHKSREVDLLRSIKINKTNIKKCKTLVLKRGYMYLSCASL